MRTDNPIDDAERWTGREDPRPIKGHCKVCDAILRGGCDGWDADDGYEIDGEVICCDCLHEYFSDCKIR